MAYTTKEILNSIRNEEGKSILTYLYKNYSQRVRKMIMDNGGRKEDAEDIFQEAIITFYKYVKLDKFNENYEVGAFIHTVAKNLWINEVKRRKVKDRYIEESNVITYEKSLLDNLIIEEKSKAIEAVFAQLGDRCRELLTYSIYHKLSMKEICEKMGFSTEDGAKTRNYKCKQHLIGLLKNNQTIIELMKDESFERKI